MKGNRTIVPPLIRLGELGHYLLEAKKAEVLNFSENQVERRYHRARKNFRPLFFWPFFMLPIFFPIDWEFTEFQPRLRGSRSSILISVKKYFGINQQEFEHLFKINGQRPYLYGGVFLGFEADPWEVGANILWFIKWRMTKN
ncbi:MAG: hypothetical protein H0W61_01200 [Bacteroidetes bacterium]|nr:hypothetical protein [Bacteroidota bacterium]